MPDDPGGPFLWTLFIVVALIFLLDVGLRIASIAGWSAT
jgi:hypothetical protein